MNDKEESGITFSQSPLNGDIVIDLLPKGINNLTVFSEEGSMVFTVELKDQKSYHFQLKKGTYIARVFNAECRAQMMKKIIVNE